MSTTGNAADVLTLTMASLLTAFEYYRPRYTVADITCPVFDGAVAVGAASSRSVAIQVTYNISFDCCGAESPESLNSTQVASRIMTVLNYDIRTNNIYTQELQRIAKDLLPFYPFQNAACNKAMTSTALRSGLVIRSVAPTPYPSFAPQPGSGGALALAGGTSTVAAIGAAVGGALLILLIVLLVFVARRRKMMKKATADGADSADGAVGYDVYPTQLEHQFSSMNVGSMSMRGLSPDQLASRRYLIGPGGAQVEMNTFYQAPQAQFSFENTVSPMLKRSNSVHKPTQLPGLHVLEAEAKKFVAGGGGGGAGAAATTVSAAAAANRPARIGTDLSNTASLTSGAGGGSTQSPVQGSLSSSPRITDDSHTVGRSTGDASGSHHGSSLPSLQTAGVAASSRRVRSPSSRGDLSESSNDTDREIEMRNVASQKLMQERKAEQLLKHKKSKRADKQKKKKQSASGDSEKASVKSDESDEDTGAEF